MTKVDWSYHRNGCKTCGKTQTFLNKHKIETASQTDARKATQDAQKAMQLATQVDEIYATKGKKVIHLVMKRDKPSADTLKQLLIGPTGNLRAPTLRIGRTLIVGFDEAMYQDVLRNK